MAILMKGAEVAGAMKAGMLQEIQELKSRGVVPVLAIVRVGSRPDDLAYERSAVKRLEDIGIECRIFELDENISQKEFVDKFSKINADPDIKGILLFRPLPKNLSEEEVKAIISPEKDMDCMSPVNIAKVFSGDDSGYAPCTPEAVMEVLDHYNIDLKGKRIAVVGRSMVVGKPLSMLLVKKNATVTICHTGTKKLGETCKNAEIVIAAAGKAKVINSDFISEGAVVIDVGINVDEKGALCGDVDFEGVSKLASYITPVPGGVGTVTSMVLAKHVIRAAKA